MKTARALRFLIVDHVAAMRTLVRDLLQDLGHLETDQADTMQAALEKLRESGFDIVVVNLDLPGESALELIRAVRSDETLRGVPVLLVADRATKDAVLAAGQAGASGCLVRPFTPAALETRIARIVERRTAVA